MAGYNENNWLVNKQEQISLLNGNVTADVKLQLTDMNKVPAANTPLQVQLIAGNKQLYKQALQTDKNGLLDINFKLPEKATKLTIAAESGGKDKIADIPLALNRDEHTDIQFMPEGGYPCNRFTGAYRL